MNPNYTRIYDQNEVNKIIARYCTSYNKKRLKEWIADKCMEPGENLLVIDFDHNSRVVQVNKKQAVKIAARYIESLEEQQ